MNYVISDVHGCYDLFLRMLDKIGFSDSDTLWFLGDAIDRGPDGLALVQDLMQRKNVVALLGNHEEMMLNVALLAGTEMSRAEQAEYQRCYVNWTWRNGGEVTWAAFCALPAEERQAVLSWMMGLSLYAELTVCGENFLLVHAGVGAWEENKDLQECTLHDFIWERMDYDRVYYPNKYLVTGHTPTALIDPSASGRIFRRNNHIVIDCGAVFTGTLGCICLETMEEFYVSQND